MARREPLSKKIRFQVLQIDDFTCQYCGRSAPNVSLEVDHIVPVAKGGTNDISNLITSCWECNIGKGTLDVKDSMDWHTDHLRDYLEDETGFPLTRTVHTYLKMLMAMYSWNEVDNALIYEIDKHFDGTVESLIDVLRRLPVFCYRVRKLRER